MGTYQVWASQVVQRKALKEKVRVDGSLKGSSDPSVLNKHVSMYLFAYVYNAFPVVYPEGQLRQ